VTKLVTAYEMNEGSGTTLADASGSGHTGTLVNGPTWVAGQAATYGQALSFDGLDDAVSVANPATYNFGTADFTIELWAKRTVLGGTQRHLFSKCDTTLWQSGCKELYFNPSNQLTFGSSSTGDTVSSTIADTNWHHIAVTFTTTTQALQIYVDGVLATTATKALEADGAGHVVTLGNLLGSNPFSGMLDEVRIYSRALSLAEIQGELTSTAKTLAFTILPGIGGDFSLQEVASGFGSVPVQMATAPDGHIFVNALSQGNIRVVTPTATPPWPVQAAPFAHLDVETGNEKGLLGIAVDPSYSSNHYVYAFYTAPGPINRVVRFEAMTSGGDTVGINPTVIFDNIPAAPNHNGGIIQFGPDGMLYIFVGENEVALDAQDLNSLRGKILRVNPADGSAPSDNPFFSDVNADANGKRVYSLGHRNSFGFTFHLHTNDLWETENGENDNDQINRIIAGGNYGWPICSGICNNPPYIDPIITFGSLVPPIDTIAPTGIVAIREDSVYPAQYHNNLLFADYKGGKLHRIVLGGPGLTDFVSHSIVCDCGQGGLFAVMHGLNMPGQDGYIYVSNGSSIFRVVLQ